MFLCTAWDINFAQHLNFVGVKDWQVKYRI